MKILTVDEAIRDITSFLESFDIEVDEELLDLVRQHVTTIEGARGYRELKNHINKEKKK